MMAHVRTERRGVGLPSEDFYRTKQILFHRILTWGKNCHQAQRVETARSRLGINVGCDLLHLQAEMYPWQMP